MPTVLGKLIEDRQALFRVRLSNDLVVPVVDDSDGGVAAVRKRDIWALADTGATQSAIDLKLCHELGLQQQGLTSVWFPQAPHTELHPTFPAALALFKSATDSATYEWPDYVPFMGLSLSDRSFSAVIGMDILRKGDFSIEKRGAVVFNF